MSEALQTRVEEVVALEMKCPKLSRNGTALKDQLITFIARLSKTNNANVTQTWSPSGSESGWERPSSACSHGVREHDALPLGLCQGIPYPQFYTDVSPPVGAPHNAMGRPVLTINTQYRRSSDNGLGYLEEEDI
ncbi:MAG: hypothetical protein Q9212_001898 [Teloschistes hypoglaucus]